MLCTFGTVYSLLVSWSFLQEALEEFEKDYSFYLIIIDAIERIPYQYKIEISRLILSMTQAFQTESLFSVYHR